MLVFSILCIFLVSFAQLDCLIVWSSIFFLLCPFFMWRFWFCHDKCLTPYVRAEVLDSPHVLIAEEEKIFVEASHGNLFEEKTLVDAVYGLKDEVKELSAVSGECRFFHINLINQSIDRPLNIPMKNMLFLFCKEILKLHRLLDEEKRARRRLENSLHQQNHQGGRYSMNGAGDRVDESFIAGHHAFWFSLFSVISSLFCSHYCIWWNFSSLKTDFWKIWSTFQVSYITREFIKAAEKVDPKKGKLSLFRMILTGYSRSTALLSRMKVESGSGREIILIKTCARRTGTPFGRKCQIKWQERHVRVILYALALLLLDVALLAFRATM